MKNLIFTLLLYSTVLFSQTLPGLNSISGYLFEYNGDTGVDTVEISGLVNSWTDVSANSYALSNTFDNRPVLEHNIAAINNKTALVFDGTSDNLFRTDAYGLTGNPAFCVFYVIYVDASDTDDKRIFYIGSSAGGGGEGIAHSARGTNATDEWPTFRWNNGATGGNWELSDGWNIVAYLFPAGGTYANAVIYVNDTLVVNTISSGGTNTANISNQYAVVGAARQTSATGYFLKGKIAFMVGFNYFPSSAEISTIFTIINNEYHVYPGWSLPVSPGVEIKTSGGNNKNNANLKPLGF